MAETPRVSFIVLRGKESLLQQNTLTLVKPANAEVILESDD